MTRKRRPLLLLTLAVACVGAAVGTAFAVVTDTASDPLTRNQVYPPVPIPEPGTEPAPKDGKVVCPGVAMKVGLHIELPCARGAKILEADFLEIDGRYCAEVTYIPERGLPSRTETLCEGDVPSVGGEPVRGPA